MSEPSKPAKRKWLIWAAGIFLLLIIIGVASSDKEDGSSNEPTAEASSEPAQSAADQVATSAVNAAAVPGLGKSRKDFTRTYSLFPHKIDFKDGGVLNGLPVLEGTGENNITMQIVGPEDDVHQVSLTLDYKGSESDQALRNLNRMAFLTDFGLDPNNWANSVVDENGTRKDWKASKSFDDLKVDLLFRNLGDSKPLVITVTAL